MTRGKIILIDKDETNNLRYTSSCEFNGDMYISWYGYEVIANLKKIKNLKDFKKYVKYFDDKNFKYADEDNNYYNFHEEIIKGDIINVCDNYFDNWFSDYLYFKNVSEEDITFVCNDKDNNVINYVLKSGEIGVFNFSELVDWKKEIIDLLSGKEID